MNKKEMVSAIAKLTGGTLNDAESALNAVTQVITEQLAAGNRIQIAGLGVFETRQRAARTGRNPKTGAEIKISAATVPAFKPAKALKDAVE